MIIQLLNRPDCHLCEVAESILRRLRLDYVMVDVDSDPALASRWGDAIPVLLFDDEEVARAPISAEAVKAALTNRKVRQA